MHTNDTSLVSGAATFGRSGHEPKDSVEINGGTYGSASGCKSSAVYYTASGCYITTGPTLTPPPNDTSLGFYVEPKYDYKGLTRIELKGTEMTVITYNETTGAEIKETGVKLPPNGLIYVQESGKGCTWEFDSENADTTEEETSEKAKGCGTVYVKGNYSSSLTIAGENNVIVNGNVYPTSVSGKLGDTDRNGRNGPDREQLRARLPPMQIGQQQNRLARKPMDLRGRPGHGAFMDRRQPGLRQQPRRTQRLRARSARTTEASSGPGPGQRTRGI